MTAPSRTYDALAAQAIGVGTVVDVKFTLSGGAVFGEALNDNSICQIAKFVTVNIGGVATAMDASLCPAGTPGTAAGTNVKLTVTSGGAIGDNTVAIQVEGLAALNVQGVNFGGYKIKNLTNALKNAGGSVTLGVNWTNAYAAGTTPAAALFETSASGPAPVFDSKNAVTLSLYNGGLGANNALATPVTWYINAADDRKLFAASPYALGNSDFSAGLGVIGVGAGVTPVGSLVLNSGSVNKGTGGIQQIHREDITPFVFMSGDSVKVTLSGDFKAFRTGSIHLANVGQSCSGTVWAGATVNALGTKAVFDLSSKNDAEINTVHELCFSPDGVTEIDETTITAAAEIDYFNVRYVKDTPAATGSIVFKVNGVQQAIPYALSGTSAYKTYLRVANNSDKAGRVTVVCRAAGSDSTTNKTTTTGILDAQLGAHNAKLYTADELATACGANGATGNGYSYVIVRGEFQYMDAGQYMFNPDGTVTQLLTNSTDGRVGINGNSLNAN